MGKVFQWLETMGNRYLGEKLNGCHQTKQGHNHSILSLTHSLTHTHTSLSLRPVDCYLASILGVCPNSAVVVPEEFPRRRFG